MAGRLDRLRVKITSGQSLSNVLDVSSHRIVAIDMPSGWDSANLTFQASAEVSDTSAVPAATYDNVYDGTGTELAVTAAASRYVVLTTAQKDALRGVRSLKIRSGTAATPVTQTADRELILVVEVR